MTSTHLSAVGHRCDWYQAIAGSHFPTTNPNWSSHPVKYQKSVNLVQERLLPKLFKGDRIRSPMRRRIILFLMNVGQTFKEVLVNIVVDDKVQTHRVGANSTSVTASVLFLLVVGIGAIRPGKSILNGGVNNDN